MKHHTTNPTYALTINNCGKVVFVVEYNPMMSQKYVRVSALIDWAHHLNIGKIEGLYDDCILSPEGFPYRLEVARSIWERLISIGWSVERK